MYLPLHNIWFDKYIYNPDTWGQSGVNMALKTQRVHKPRLNNASAQMHPDITDPNPAVSLNSHQCQREFQDWCNEIQMERVLPSPAGAASQWPARSPPLKCLFGYNISVQLTPVTQPRALFCAQSWTFEMVKMALIAKDFFDLHVLDIGCISNTNSAPWWNVYLKSGWERKPGV